MNPIHKFIEKGALLANQVETCKPIYQLDIVLSMEFCVDKAILFLVFNVLLWKMVIMSSMKSRRDLWQSF